MAIEYDRSIIIMVNIVPWADFSCEFCDFSRVVSSVETENGSYPVLWQKNAEGFFTASLCGMHFECRTESGNGRIKISAKAKLDSKLRHFRFNLLDFPAVECDHFFGCGESMGGAQALKFPVEKDGKIVSSHNCVFTVNGRNTVLSTPLKQNITNKFKGEAVGKYILNFKVAFELDECDITDMEFDTVSIECADAFSLLRQYGKDNADSGKDFSKPPVFGWSTWDYYRWTITEDEVIKNAEFIAADPILSKYIKRIIIDDGWQYCYGEWDANSLFPSGMKKLADRISALGFEPGLWFAPSVVEPQCRIAQWDYDMLCMNEAGQAAMYYSCMERVGFVIDPTVKKSQDFLRKLFDRYAAMGYRYFKLDFLSSCFAAGTYHDRTIPRCQLVGKLLQPVFEGVAGRSEILGCNYPFCTGRDVVNAVRVGGDIHALWESIKYNTPSVAYMFWANRVLWMNDPDFALARGLETSDDPDLNRLKPVLVYTQKHSREFSAGVDGTLATMKYEEAKVLLSLDLMAAGAVNLSDKLPLLKENALDLLRKTVSAECAETAVPLDMFEELLPSHWLQKTSTGHRMLLINWQDEPAEIAVRWASVGRKPTQVRDFWNGTVSDAPEKVMLAPHNCYLMEF